MIEDALLCPDCGGVVGASQRTEAGAPCTCFSSARKGPADTDIVPSPDSPEFSAALTEKRCRICGMDVAGRRRVKDPSGYYCYDCYKAEERRLHEGRVRCRACGRLAKEGVLTEYEGIRMCPQCLEERKELHKQRVQRIGIVTTQKRYEKRQVLALCIAAVVLLLIIFLGRMHWL
jgi:hypothetical protein